MAILPALEVQKIQLPVVFIIWCYLCLPPLENELTLAIGVCFFFLANKVIPLNLFACFTMWPHTRIFKKNVDIGGLFVCLFLNKKKRKKERKKERKKRKEKKGKERKRKKRKKKGKEKISEVFL
jgi:hypothetical protein